MGKKHVKAPKGCYLGWDGCTNKADVRVGNAWMCNNCVEVSKRGE